MRTKLGTFTNGPTAHAQSIVNAAISIPIQTYHSTFMSIDASTTSRQFEISIWSLPLTSSGGRVTIAFMSSGTYCVTTALHCAGMIPSAPIACTKQMMSFTHAEYNRLLRYMLSGLRKTMPKVEGHITVLYWIEDVGYRPHKRVAKCTRHCLMTSHHGNGALHWYPILCK